MARPVHAWIAPPMEYRHRVAVALHDRAECAAVADWLTAKGFEPLPRSGVQAVLDEMDAQAFDLLLIDAASRCTTPCARRRAPGTPASR